MNRKELIEYIQKTYAVIPEYLWSKYPNYAVFRHHNHSKWFAVIMDVAENKLFDTGKNNKVDVINLKVPVPLVGALRLKKSSLSRLSYEQRALDFYSLRHRF